MNEFDFVNKHKETIPLETKLFVKKCFDIIDLIHESMEDQNILQKDLAAKLNKSEAEISKWLNGVQNFTLKTLCKLEWALGRELITVPCNRNIIKSVLVKNIRLGSKTVTSKFEKFERAKQENKSDNLPIAA